LKTKAHLFRYDSTYGIYPGTVETSDATMTVDGREIAVLNQKDSVSFTVETVGRGYRH
jgi:glyceraldehyde 3-phosphate dehydrogenase